MVEQNSQIAAKTSSFRPDLWSGGAVLIAVLVLMPIAAVVWIALNPSENIWPHLLNTTLPRYLKNTSILAVSVAGLSAVAGTLTAWMVTMYRFPGSGLLQWLLLLPLAIPAYVGAYFRCAPVWSAWRIPWA